MAKYLTIPEVRDRIDEVAALLRPQRAKRPKESDEARRRRAIELLNTTLARHPWAPKRPLPLPEVRS